MARASGHTPGKAVSISTGLAPDRADRRRASSKPETPGNRTSLTQTSGGACACQTQRLLGGVRRADAGGHGARAGCRVSDGNRPTPTMRTRDSPIEETTETEPPQSMPARTLS
jgi:hypothetical protein